MTWRGTMATSQVLMVDQSTIVYLLVASGLADRYSNGSAARAFGDLHWDLPQGSPPACSWQPDLPDTPI